MSEPEQVDITLDLMWAISVLACRPSRAHIAGIEMHHDALLVWAISEEEAVGKAISKYAIKHPAKDGWSINTSGPVPVRKAVQDELGDFSNLIESTGHV